MKPRAKHIIFVMSLGLTFIVIPIILLFFNTVLMLAKYQLRLANGTLLHNLIQQEIEGPKVLFYLFNFTNADSYMAGEDAVLKVEEIGPFVYQEYRTNDDLEFNVEPGIMRYTPNHRRELLLEESIGKPEDFDLVLPNIALLSGVQLLSKYPYFLGQFLKVLTSAMSRKALTKINAKKYLWDNTDPFIRTVNTVVPGLIYYKSTGIITRFYDIDAKYRLTVGTSDLDKFQVKSVKRFIDKKKSSETMSENTKSYIDTYEGVAFPPQLTPEAPISIYRHSICKAFKMVYVGTKQMKYGADAFVYNLSNESLNTRNVCNTKGWCRWCFGSISVLFRIPYSGFPLAITKGHFLDTEPKMFEKIEGLKPNRSLHDITLTVDPNLGLTVEASMSVQLNLALGDMSLLPETKRLSDLFLPISQTVVIHPKMREEAKSMLRLMYTYGPYIVISSQVVCALLGIFLLAYSARMMCWTPADHSPLSNKCSAHSSAPLLK